MNEKMKNPMIRLLKNRDEILETTKHARRDTQRNRQIQ